ncbi:hypothetical protein LCGC14_2116200, partial [marine sediment metagenome]
ANSCRDLIIVSIGTLTNIATALVKEPNLAKKAELVMMGGVVNSQRAEYNVSCDPEAARIVFESGIEIIIRKELPGIFLGAPLGNEKNIRPSYVNTNPTIAIKQILATIKQKLEEA